MDLLQILYNIIIFPLVQIIETVFVLIFRIFKNTGFAVIGVSFAVTFLCLPLYIVAEKWQEKERDIIKSLTPGIKLIKSVFKGDEQYMILSTYYRQNHYHPVYALRNSFGILIQIPFFIAAYSFLSHQETLRGEHFFFIRDMLQSDSLLRIGALRLNLLPILMTAINCISGAVYTKDLPAQNKIQVYGTAAIFLLLLYNSPSGLVLYWTMNNILSLVKNIFYKFKNPLKILYFVLCFAAALFIIYLLFFNDRDLTRRLYLVWLTLFVFFTPLIIKFIVYIEKNFLSVLLTNDKNRFLLLILSCLLLAVLTGLCIPGGVIASSPTEFSFIDSYTSPFIFLIYSFCKFFGSFVFWPLCIYFLFNRHIQTILTVLFSFAAFNAVVSNFAFQGSYGVISTAFTFNSTGVLSMNVLFNMLNILSIMIVLITVLWLIKKEKIPLLISASGIVLVSLSTLTGYNFTQIQKEYHELALRQSTSEAPVHTVTPVFSLAKDKPNVIVFMQDCAINGFVKPIFEEHPQLQEQFDGFTLYPNTVSFAMHTLMGAPPLWGGYEYTPKEINNRDTVPLIEKNNEALLVLPVLFEKEGFNVTVTDPSWANHEWIADTSIYDQYENINAFNTKSRYSSLWYGENNFGEDEITAKKIIRNIFWFSVLKISPSLFRPIIYDTGWYWGTEDFGDSLVDFIDSYAVLDFLPELTAYDSEKPAALLITNEATHEPSFLQYPDYVPRSKITNRGSGKYSYSPFYHVNNAFYLKFGEWLTELKRNGVYDNTRIIVVSDHGAGIEANLASTDIPIPGERREKYNPVLLVKDFNAHGQLKFDMSFRTNADTPVLATAGIVGNPVNPFSGKPLITSQDIDGAYISINHLPLARQHGKYTFKIREDQWIFVHDNIFDENNWEKPE
ncbi:membrane protein [Spirochaetia bacterium]|nr:membrane protein [Spirochaetia bacterium]